MLGASSLPQQALDENMDLLEGITGFEDSVRKCESCEPGFLRGWGQCSRDLREGRLKRRPTRRRSVANLI